jgi:hypothetical protein
MTAGETKLEMAVRHVAEQENVSHDRKSSSLNAFEKSERHRMMRSDCWPQCKTF